MVRLALGDDECAGYGYERTEVLVSRKEKGHLEFDVLDDEDGEVLIADFGVDWRHIKQHTLNDKRLAEWLKVFEEDTGLSLEIFGYSDCTGSERNNLLLRRGRARAVYRLLGPSARNRVKFYGEAPTGTYVSGNDTVVDRAQNRSVLIKYSRTINFANEKVNQRTCEEPDKVPKNIQSLDDYVTLIRCIEQAFPSFTPRRMLSLLRQRYQGAETWSCTKISQWTTVIPCGMKIKDPLSTKGWYLLEALCSRKDQSVQVIPGVGTANQFKNSRQKCKDVDLGLDIGHIYTGLEAMTCPKKTLRFPDNEGDWVGDIRVTNEDFATWVGDLASTIAAFVADREFKSSKKPLDEYLFCKDSRASEADLLADIDCYSIRCGLLRIKCAGSRLKAIKPFNRKISTILEEYYLDIPGPLQGRIDRRFSCFLKAIGGNVTGGNSLVNPGLLIDSISSSIYPATEVFYLKNAFIARGGNTLAKVKTGLSEVPKRELRAATKETSKLFVDWLIEGLKLEQ
jgi:hypothetical protein